MKIEELKSNFYILVGGYLALVSQDKFGDNFPEFLEEMEKLFNAK